jgi:hypothetical protein
MTDGRYSTDYELSYDNTKIVSYEWTDPDTGYTEVFIASHNPGAERGLPALLRCQAI